MIVVVVRRLTEMLYALLRNKTEYEPRPWRGVILIAWPASRWNAHSGPGVVKGNRFRLT